MKSAGFDKDYGESTKRYKRLLLHPIFTVSRLQEIDEGITYRQVNAWESEGLIISSREKLDTGWRKFSIMDSVKLKTIFDLKKMGFSRERVRNVMGEWDSAKISLWNPKGNRVLSLVPLGVEHFIMASLSGVKVFLVIKENGETFFLSKTGAKRFYMDSNNESSPIITLPFFSYAEKTADAMKKQMGLEKNSTVEELFETMLPYQERRISRWIRSRNYTEILFREFQSKETLIKSGSRKDKKFSDKDILEAISSGEYCSIVITTRRKQKVKIVRKEWMARIKTQKGTPRLNM